MAYAAVNGSHVNGLGGEPDMKSMLIIAAGLAGKQKAPLSFLPANSQRRNLSSETLRFGSYQEELDAPPPVAIPRPG